MLQDLGQSGGNQATETFTMSPSTRLIMWLALFIGMVGSAPLDEERIYFPGENPYGATDSRSNGEHSSLLPNELPQSDLIAKEDSRHMVPWSQHSSQENFEDAVPQQLDVEPSYGSSSAYESGYDRQLEGNLQYQPAGGNLQASYSRLGQPQGALSYEASKVLSNQQPSIPHGALSDLPRGFLHQGEKFARVPHSGQEMKTQLWTQSHFLSPGARELGQGSNQETVHEGGSDLMSSNLQHSIASNAHHTHSKELSSILDRPVQNQIHPNLKQAFGHALQDFGETSLDRLQPSHHSVHKISLMKKTTVQNVGREPTHIQSTSSNDDISLSHLIQQLQMLEQSPKHVNITWCEEKIKEFLHALRRKQASGVFINQEVQEETLHQILTHEAVESTQHREQVHEPLISKVTVTPLGVENFSQSHQMLGVNMHKQGSHSPGVDESISKHVDTSQEDYLSYSQPEILTIIPYHESSSPEIMSHQQALIRDVPVPPFTSDNSDDLKELELELPEYVPFEQAHSGEVNIVKSHTKTDTLSLLSQHKTSTPATFTGQEEKASVPEKVPEEIEQFPKLHKQETHNDSFGASEENLNPTLHGSELELFQQTSDAHHQNHYQLEGDSIQKGYLEEKPALNVIPSIEIAQDDGKEISYGYAKDFKGSHHVIHGRPQAPQGEIVLEATGEQKIVTNESLQEHNIHSAGSNLESIQVLHKQQIDYDTLIEELIQLESIPGHQAIDKCEEKIQEFLEILKYQQEQGFGQNQLELEKLHQTLIQQAQERGKQLANVDSEVSTLAPASFWKRVQKNIKKTYEGAKDRVKEVVG